jgi:DNA-binding HxlR family transcriptional regulator
MKEAAAHTPTLCNQFHHAVELIGRRWNGAIIWVLLQDTCRYATLRDAIPDITDRMLSERLQELEEEGVVARTVVPDTPVRVEYSLTKKGRALAAAIDSISEWAGKHVAAEKPATKPAPKAAKRGRQASAAVR